MPMYHAASSDGYDPNPAPVSINRTYVSIYQESYQILTGVAISDLPSHGFGQLYPGYIPLGHAVGQIGLMAEDVGHGEQVGLGRGERRRKGTAVTGIGYLHLGQREGCTVDGSLDLPKLDSDFCRKAFVIIKVSGHRLRAQTGDPKLVCGFLQDSHKFAGKGFGDRHEQTSFLNCDVVVLRRRDLPDAS